ncbi:MAG: hypothetical protein ACNS61_11220 [Candidatus Wenzhouxiangella sp. M2_3B_020]
MLTRDSERVIEVLLLAGVLLAAISLDVNDAGRPAARYLAVDAHLVENAGTAETVRAVETGSSSAERIAVGPFQALGAQLRRAVRDLAELPKAGSIRSC